MRLRSQRQSSLRRGFTLLEMLIVLAIILVVAAMVVPNLLGRQKKANIQATKVSISGLEKTLKLYSVDNAGEYPMGGDEVLADLMEPVEDASGTLIEPVLDEIPKDAWGEILHYEYPNSKSQNTTKPAIWSSGPNRSNEDGSGDDINNWAELEY